MQRRRRWLSGYLIERTHKSSGAPVRILNSHSIRWTVDSTDIAGGCQDALMAQTDNTCGAQRILTLLDVVICERAAILQLLARKDEPLLVRRDACSQRRPFAAA